VAAIKSAGAASSFITLLLIRFNTEIAEVRGQIAGPWQKSEVKSQIAEVQALDASNTAASLGFYFCNLTSDFCNRFSQSDL
jgi:hypothetical protein